MNTCLCTVFILHTVIVFLPRPIILPSVPQPQCLSCFLSGAIGFLSLHKKTEWITRKFVGGNHHHQQIKWLHFGRNCTGNRDRDQDMTENLNQHQENEHGIHGSRCRSVKQVLMPREWIWKFCSLY